MTLLGEGGTTDGGANSGASGGGNAGGTGASGGGNSGGSQSGGSSGSQAGGQSGGQASWRDTLPEDLKSNVGLTKFNDVGALAKSYLEVQSYVGKKGVFPPGEKATPEQWKEFAKAIGQPELEKFDIKAPEGKKVNPQIAEGFKKLAHESGLLPHQAQGIMNWFLGQEEASLESRKAAFQSEQKVLVENLKKDWGQGFDKQIAYAKLAAKELGGDDLLAHLEKTGLGNDAHLVRLLAKAGALMGEDKLRGANSGSKFGQTPDEIQGEITRVMGDAKHPYFDRSHPGHAQAVREMEERYKKLNP